MERRDSQVLAFQWCLSTVISVLKEFILNTIQVKTSKQYLFGKRDTTKEGEPLGKIIDMVTILVIFVWLSSKKLASPIANITRYSTSRISDKAKGFAKLSVMAERTLPFPTIGFKSEGFLIN